MIFELKNESSLIQAVFSGDFTEVESLVKKKCDVNQQSSNGRISALHVAVYCSGSSYKNAENIHSSNNTEEDSKQMYIDIVKLLCCSGSRVNCKDSKGLTALHYACRTNSPEAVRILLEYQADVNTRDKNWQTPLHVCSVYNSIECARLLLSYISNIDATDRQGRSALAHAAFNGNIQLVEILLENGANTNVQDKQERRPLHWASYVGYNDIIRLLVKYGADINSLDKDLFTPLLVACASGKSEESIRLLIELGADTSAMTIHDSSIFHLACLNGHDHIVKELLYNQKLKMKTNSKGYHPLHYTAGCKQGAFCLELLINLNIDVNMAGFDGRTAMHIAALHGRTACAEILFSNGAQLNIKDVEGNTPLHLAAFNGHSSMVSFLIENGANIYIKGYDGMVPLAMAALNGHSDCFRPLIEFLVLPEACKEYFELKDDFERTFMHLAAISGNYECLKLFISLDCDKNPKDYLKNTPIHYACVGSYLKCIELLVSSGAQVNETNISLPPPSSESSSVETSFLGGFGCTPLMLACAFDSDGYVVRELILNSEARADLLDLNGYNVLHYASLQGNRNVFEILLDHCKNLDHQANKDGISPLHILAYNGYRDCLEFLLKCMFEPDVVDKNGRTPLDLACFRGESQCVECLLNYGANWTCKDQINERTCVHAAAYNNNEDCIKIINHLVSSYEKQLYATQTKLINVKDKHGRTPLMCAIEKGHFNTVQFLISQLDADTLACDNNKRSALHRAAALGCEETCNLILKANLNSIYQKDINDLLPIHYAVMFGHSNLINVLFEYCVVDQNKLCDKSGFALLHYACFFGHFECIETLCELGELNTFLIEPIFHTSDVVFNRFSPLHCVCYNGHSSALTYLLEKYSDLDDFCIDLEDAYGNRPLHICALRNEYECASHLIEHNCNINAMNKKAQTAFMLAAANNSFNMLELLIADMSSSNTSLPTKNESISNLKGVDLMCVDNEGNNALHLSLIQKHENCALFILDHIDSNSYLINLKNKQGKTALHLAASNGFQTSVEILLSKGADLFVKDNKLRTPITSCAKNEQVADCLELLLKRLMFMLSTPAAKSILIQHGGINNIQLSCKKNATINICKNGNQNDLLNDSTYNLTSGVILNDVNMNTISNRDGDTTSTLKLNDCIRIQNEITNLNSTLNNEVEFLEPVPSEQQNIYKLVESTNCNRNLFISSFLDIIENQNGSGTGSKLNASEFLSSNIRSSSTSSFDSEFY